MSHHISTRFVGAFAKIHITQGKYLSQNSKMIWEKEYSFCYPAPRQYGQNHSFQHARYLKLHFLFKIVG